MRLISSPHILSCFCSKYPPITPTSSHSLQSNIITPQLLQMRARSSPVSEERRNFNKWQNIEIKEDIQICSSYRKWENADSELVQENIVSSIGKVDFSTCSCGESEQTGGHVMFKCPKWADYRKSWKTWEDIDLRWKQWLLPHRDDRGGVKWVENLLETFCTKVQLQA